MSSLKRWIWGLGLGYLSFALAFSLLIGPFMSLGWIWGLILLPLTLSSSYVVIVSCWRLFPRTMKEEEELI